MTDHQNWLAEYARTGSDAAFRELVTRYVDLVYSTALRLVGGDTHRAEDVAQTVFANLARSARTLPQDVKLGGWLHRDTCFTASTLMRGERRRQARERQAVEMNALQNTSEADFSLVAPVLDEAINELGDEDRAAILLRFFEQNNFRTVGAALGSNEDAARMRVTRALEKLEAYLKRRGITTTAASLGVVLSANAVQAAPVSLALTISTAAALAGTTLATTATITATKAIAMTTIQKTLVTATIAVLAGVGIYEARQAAQLSDQVQMLQQQKAPLAEQIQALQRERDDLTNRLATFRDANDRLNQNVSELLKLRNEIRQLRDDKRELLGQLQDANAREQNTNTVALEQAIARQIRRIVTERKMEYSLPVSTTNDKGQPNFTGVCIQGLVLIDGAKQQWALERNARIGVSLSQNEVASYLKGEVLPVCPLGGTYSINPLGTLPTCTISGHKLP